MVPTFLLDVEPLTREPYVPRGESVIIISKFLPTECDVDGLDADMGSAATVVLPGYCRSLLDSKSVDRSIQRPGAMLIHQFAVVPAEPREIVRFEIGFVRLWFVH